MDEVGERRSWKCRRRIYDFLTEHKVPLHAGYLGSKSLGLYRQQQPGRDRRRRESKVGHTAQRGWGGVVVVPEGTSSSSARLHDPW
jgi:hypothetical protein